MNASEDTVIKVNPDLDKERQNATINVEELACILHDGPDNLKRKRAIG